MIRSVGNTENKDVPFFPIQVHGPLIHKPPYLGPVGLRLRASQNLVLG